MPERASTTAPRVPVRMTVARQIVLLVVFLLTLMAVVSAVSLMKLSGIQREIHKSRAVYMPMRKELQRMQRLVAQHGLAVERAMPESTGAPPIDLMKQERALAAIRDDMDRTIGTVRELVALDLAQARRSGIDEETDEARAEFHAMSRLLLELEPELEALETLGEEAIVAVRSGDEEAARARRDAAYLTGETLIEELRAGNALVDSFLEDSTNDAESRESDAGVTILGVAVGALFVGTFVALLIARRVASSVGAVSAAAVRVGEHLDRDEIATERIDVRSPDEMGALALTINRMLDSLALHAMRREQAERRAARRADELALRNEELRRLIAAASHDLRTPLRSVVSFAQLLERSAGATLEGDSADYMRFVVDGGRRMGELLDDLQRYLLVSVASDETVEEVDLGGLAAGAVATYDRLIAKIGARVSVGALPVVLGVQAHLQIVLEELVGNALKFQDGTFPEVTIGAERIADGWRICISDRGIGIDERYRERIFELFSRLNLPEEHDGTGMGLALCRRIVERHGGLIGMEPRQGGGSRFWFTVPDAPRGHEDRLA